MRRLFRRATLAVVAASALIVVGTMPVAAYNFGSANPISGTCPESGNWFVSNNIRTRSGSADSSRVQFGLTPQFGIAFFVRDYNTGISHGTVYSPPLNTWLNLALGDAPYQFVNWFRLEQAGHQGNYNFAGSESY
jgi:hypothetical protein